MNAILSTGATAADIAWAAGLFEGEGSVYFRKTSANRTAGLSLRTTDLDVLDRFQRVLGRGKVYGPYANGPRARKPIWQWGCQGFQAVQAIVALFWDHLGERRREKAAEILIATRRAKPHNPRARKALK